MHAETLEALKDSWRLQGISRTSSAVTWSSLSWCSFRCRLLHGQDIRSWCRATPLKSRGAVHRQVLWCLRCDRRTLRRPEEQVIGKGCTDASFPPPTSACTIIWRSTCQFNLTDRRCSFWLVPTRSKRNVPKSCPRYCLQDTRASPCFDSGCIGINGDDISKLGLHRLGRSVALAGVSRKKSGIARMSCSSTQASIEKIIASMNE